MNDVVFTSNSSKIISCGDDREIIFWKNSVYHLPLSQPEQTPLGESPLRPDPVAVALLTPQPLPQLVLVPPLLLLGQIPKNVHPLRQIQTILPRPHQLGPLVSGVPRPARHAQLLRRPYSEVVGSGDVESCRDILRS